MTRRAVEIWCVFSIHLARLRAEAGPFLLAAIVFPSATYLFARAVGGEGGGRVDETRFLAGSLVFSLSLTSISWLGYLLLENRFTGRLKLLATLPLAPSSYVLGALLFAVSQAVVGTCTLLVVGRALGVPTRTSALAVAGVVVLTMLALAGLSVVVAARARSFAEGSLLTDALGAGLVFLAPVYYAADALPRVAQVACSWLPTACAARAMQSALTGSAPAFADVAALALEAVVALGIGFRATSWRER